NKQFTVGQSIVVEFMIPKRFSVNVDVAYCRAFNLKSRIISNQNFRYRVAAKFTFLKEGERTLLRQFIQSIEPEIQKQLPPKVTQGKQEGGDDDFGDLDDLDISFVASAAIANCVAPAAFAISITLTALPRSAALSPSRITSPV